ncbi:heme peroxidase [Mycena latifolia]|nr:heme peroxidase [Mycena latifolia]
MLRLAPLLYLAAASAYIWPSPQLDALEAMRFDQNGVVPRPTGTILGFVAPCDQFAFGGLQTGRANVPDWIRAAYHDMATHNSADGSGGMDASIRFADEQARPENAGDGFQNTLVALSSNANRYISIADVLALGTIIAVENWQVLHGLGGPEIAFRGGRVDAAEPNAPGVPEPQQDLQTHITDFSRQGFTQEEMIGLVACGHSFGGVQHAVFPDIVPELNDTTNTESVAHFDSTFVHFDNNVATEYISGTTLNPLVVGSNDTTNSDKRIFGSDGNATMRSFADSPEIFASTCATLFARMLDTVPRAVPLTEVIIPLPVKPSEVELSLQGDTLLLSGEVRFWNMTEDPTRIVRLLWDDHIGRTTDNNATLQFAGTTAHFGSSAAWYAFRETSNSSSISLNATAGIIKMRFTVNSKLEDQGGIGFAVQDSVVFSETSRLISNQPFAGRFDVAVRNDVNPARVYLEEQG